MINVTCVESENYPKLRRQIKRDSDPVACGLNKLTVESKSRIRLYVKIVQPKSPKIQILSFRLLKPYQRIGVLRVKKAATSVNKFLKIMRIFFEEMQLIYTDLK